MPRGNGTSILDLRNVERNPSVCLAISLRATKIVRLLKHRVFWVLFKLAAKLHPRLVRSSRHHLAKLIFLPSTRPASPGTIVYCYIVKAINIDRGTPCDSSVSYLLAIVLLERGFFASKFRKCSSSLFTVDRVQVYSPSCDSFATTRLTIFTMTYNVDIFLNLFIHTHSKFYINSKRRISVSSRSNCRN